MSLDTADFWQKVDKRQDCWEWTGLRDPRGYGTLMVDGHNRRAHRVSYELVVGPIPDGLVLDHLCRNTSCVRPLHLEPVTQRENLLRGNAPAAINARKTHCINGHEFTPENTYAARGWRTCRACSSRRDRERRARQRSDASSQAHQ